jgi:TM2 domain-containing membrane protein YozV
MKNRTTAALLSLFLGGIGGQNFYLGHTMMGLLSLLFCWTFIPAILGLVDFIRFLSMTDRAFNAKYNAAFAALQAQPQQIVVNVQNTASATNAGDTMSRLKELHEMKVSGILMEVEFQAEKGKLLAAR